MTGRACFRRVSRIPRCVVALGAAVVAVGGVEAAQRYRSFCGWCDHEEPCGQADQMTCDTGPACDAGFLVWDFPDQAVDCPGICGPDEVVTHGCYDPDDPPSCSLCGGPIEPPCPAGSACTAGCESWLTPIDGLCQPCGGPFLPVCQDGDPPCGSGYVQAGGTCFAEGCGGNAQPLCPNGACQPGLEPQALVCVNCGGDQEPECVFGEACRYGTGPLGPGDASVDFARICAYCGGGPGGEKIACEGGCDPGYYHATTSGLSGPIAECSTFVDPGIEAYFVNQNGICSPGSPEPMARIAPESWPVADPPVFRRGTLVILHGRGADCGPAKEAMLGPGGLEALGHVVHCVEYAQEDTPGVDRRLVRVLPVSDGASEFDEAHPAVEILAPTFDVPGVATALKDALLSIPTEGDVTLIPHSQGGFIARELVYSHYDELRWRGKRIARVVSLAHPHYAKEVDPHLYTPWHCSEFDDFDCATGEWVWGWDLHALGAGASIDDSDYPQIEWTAVSGDGPPGNTTPEDVDGDGQSGDDAACVEIFGGVPHAAIAGDTSVPIQSSLGWDECGYFLAPALAFDRRYHTTCTHNAACLIAQPLLAPVPCAGSGTPPSPADSCWGTDPEPALIPAAIEPPSAFDALDFDGDDQVAVTDPGALAALDMATGLTLEAWIRPDAALQNATFLSKEGEYQIALIPVSGKSVLAWTLKNAAPGWNWTYTTFEPPAYRWTHVALTYDGSTVRVYANGVEVQSLAASGAIGDQHPQENELRIGGRQLYPTGFGGSIDDVRVWNRALSRAEVIAGAGGDPGAGNLAGLVGWWGFDEAEGGDALIDAGPNGFDLSLSTLGPAATPARRAGIRDARPGGALYFDGVDDVAVVDEPAALAALDMAGQLTLEAWINPRGPGHPVHGGSILQKEGEYTLTRWGDGRITWALANASPGWVSIQSTFVAPLRTWTHVALVYDASAGQAKLYANGVLHQTWSATGLVGDFNPSANALRIGFTGTQKFHGALDEVRVWNVARSAAEIAASWDRVLADPGSQPGLVGNWSLDGPGAGMELDAASGHHAALGVPATATSPAAVLAPQLPGYRLLYPTRCGNGSVDPPEDCDDGAVSGGDGCSAACRAETVFELHGVAAGGTVSLVVEGVTIAVVTEAGQTAAQVAAQIAAAIEANATLQALEVTAVAAGNVLHIGGAYDEALVDDPGLADCTSGPDAPRIDGPLANVCPDTSVTLGTNGHAAHQWYYEGQPIPGAVGQTYVATLSGEYRVQVQDSLGCPAESADAAVLVSFCPESEISPPGAVFPLRTENSLDSPTGRWAYFQRSDGVEGYHVYEGTLGSWFDHGSGPANACDLQPCAVAGDPGCFDDLGTGELRTALALSPGDRYFLVAGHAGGVEGPAHRSSAGLPSDPAQATCPP